MTKTAKRAAHAVLTVLYSLDAEWDGDETLRVAQVIDDAGVARLERALRLIDTHCEGSEAAVFVANDHLKLAMEEAASALREINDA